MDRLGILVPRTRPNATLNRAVWTAAFLFGTIQAWFAAGYRQGTPAEKMMIFVPWLVFRLLFLAAYGCAAILWRRDGRI